MLHVAFFRYIYVDILIIKDDNNIVDVEIRTNKELIKLYTTGKSKKYPLPSQIIDSFFKVLAILDAAMDINDLISQPSMNFKRLKSKKNMYSLRLNKKYRLEVSIEWKNKEKTIGIIGVEDISNHNR